MNKSTSRDCFRAIIAEANVERRCGLHPWERHPERPNRLRVTVKLHARLPAGPIGSRAVIDYDRVRQFLRTFPSLPHVDLLETVAEEIVAKCFEDESVESCFVSVLKPDIFNEVEAAGIEVFRTREGWQA